MMIDLPTAERFAMREVASLLDVHVSTIWRWANRGVRGHRLCAFRVGGRMFVLRSALETFLLALNRPATDVAETQDPGNPTDVDNELDAAGI